MGRLLTRNLSLIPKPAVCGLCQYQTPTLDDHTMHPEARRLLEMYLATARDTEHEASAEANLAYATGMIGYAVACGHITPAEHAAEFTMIRLVREQRSSRVGVV